MKIKVANAEFLEMATSLSPEEAERVLSRMTGKLPRRLDKEKLTREEAIAVQLEIEEEQLSEWRERMNKIREKQEEKQEKKKD